MKLRRVTTAVDTGIAVNPDTVIAQLQGGLIFGLTAALYGEITLKKGRVQQSNFHDYRMLRIDQVPPIEVHVIKSDEPPGGIGETGATASIPALRNAIYAATGVALRRMPIDRNLLARGAAHEADFAAARISLIVGLAVIVVAGPRRLDDAAAGRARASRGGMPSTLAAYNGPSPIGVPAELRAADLVSARQYLAQAADCEFCHTVEGGQPFAGGRAIRRRSA